MATPIQMKHPSGVTATAFTGFSWTALFFGIFVPAFRADFKWAGIYLAVTIVNVMLMSVAIGFFTSFIWWIAFAVKYNEWQMNDLKLKGFTE